MKKGLLTFCLIFLLTTTLGGMLIYIGYNNIYDNSEIPSIDNTDDVPISKNSTYKIIADAGAYGKFTYDPSDNDFGGVSALLVLSSYDDQIFNVFEIDDPFERSGVEFLGWTARTATNSDGSYVLNYSVSNKYGWDFTGIESYIDFVTGYGYDVVYWKDSANLTLYPVWEGNFKVTYNANGGTMVNYNYATRTTNYEASYGDVWTHVDDTLGVVTLSGIMSSNFEIIQYYGEFEPGTYNVGYDIISGEIVKRYAGCFAFEFYTADNKSLTDRAVCNIAGLSNHESGTLYLSEENSKLAGMLKIWVWYDSANGGGYHFHDLKLRLYAYLDEPAITSQNITETATAMAYATRPGYVFSGWNSEADGTGTYYGPSDVATLTNDITLYAIWLDNTPPTISRVTYTQNDGASYYAYAYATDSAGLDRVQFPTWTENGGQDDIVWYTGQSGNWTIDGQAYNYRYLVQASNHNNEFGTYITHVYAYDVNGNSVGNGSMTNIQIEYTLQINPNGGAYQNSTSTVSSTGARNNMVVALDDPVRTGYDFTGWSTTSGTIKEAVLKDARSFNGSSDFIALGRNYMYTDKLTFSVTAYMDDWSQYQSSSMRLISCTEAGGWNIEPNGQTVRFAVYDAGKKGYNSITTSVKWTDLSGWVQFTMVFDGTYATGYINGEQVGQSSAFSGGIGYNSSNGIFIGAEAGSNATSPASGYFKGQIRNVHIINGIVPASQISNLDASYTLTLDKNATLTANWQLQSYTITWNGNADDVWNSKYWNFAGSGGYSASNLGSNAIYVTSETGKTATSVVTYASSVSYYTPLPLRVGYNFVGWWTESSSGVKVADENGELISNVSGYTDAKGNWIKVGNCMLYAHWESKHYEYDGINYSLDGSSVTIIPKSKTGYKTTGFKITMYLDRMYQGQINQNTGVQEYGTSWPNAVYYEPFYIMDGIEYTAELSGGQVRFRIYNEDGTYYGSNGAATVTGENKQAVTWYHLGNDKDQIAVSFIIERTSQWSFREYNIVGDVEVEQLYEPNVYTISLENDMPFKVDIDAWERYHYTDDRVSTTYDAKTATNSFTITTAGEFEIIGFELDVVKNADYKITFDYEVPTYQNFSTYDGFGFQVLFAEPLASDNLDRDLATYYFPKTASKGTATVTFNSSNYTKVYIILNGGFINDGQTVTFKIGNFEMTGTSKIYLKYGVGFYQDSACKTSISKVDILNKQGFTFNGYFTSENGQGSKIINADGSILAGFETYTSSNDTLYANYNADNPAYFDEEGGYWYVELGMFPQSLVENQTIINALNSASDISKTYTIAGETLPTREYNGDQYCLYKGNWYKVEPVKWRIEGNYSSGYGVEDAEITAICSEILFARQFNDTAMTTGQGYRDSLLNKGEFYASTGIGGEPYSQFITHKYRKIQSYSVQGTNTTDYDGWYHVSSIEEIESVWGKYTGATFSDLVSAATNNGIKFWVRDLGSNLNNAKCMTTFGMVTQDMMQNILGVQYTITVTGFGCV